MVFMSMARFHTLSPVSPKAPDVDVGTSGNESPFLENGICCRLRVTPTRSLQDGRVHEEPMSRKKEKYICKNLMESQNAFNFRLADVWRPSQYTLDQEVRMKTEGGAGIWFEGEKRPSKSRVKPSMG